MADQLAKLFQPGLGAGNYFKQYNDYLHQRLQEMDGSALEAMVQAFLTARKNDNIIYFVGNGGSAATASHFAQDLAAVGQKAAVSSFRTLSLTDNTSYITALGNDLGFDKIFSEQLRHLFKKDDVLVAISASGNSPNIIAAAELAKKLGGHLFALTGFDGGKLATLAHHTLLVATPKGEYGPVEDAHMIIDHVVTGYLLEILAK
jgi:D-sedoheptulose 7-phosphate isomerase